MFFFSFYWINDFIVSWHLWRIQAESEKTVKSFILKKKICSSWIFLWTSHWMITELQKHSSCSENCHMRFRLRSFQKICQTHLILFESDLTSLYGIPVQICWGIYKMKIYKWQLEWSLDISLLKIRDGNDDEAGNLNEMENDNGKLICIFGR